MTRAFALLYICAFLFAANRLSKHTPAEWLTLIGGAIERFGYRVRTAGMRRVHKERGE